MMSSCIGCSQGEVLASPEAANGITCNLSNADTRESLLTLGGFVSPRPHLHSHMAELKPASAQREDMLRNRTRMLALVYAPAISPTAGAPPGASLRSEG